MWLHVHMYLPGDVLPAIVGRDREQAELGAALARAVAGHGGAVLVPWRRSLTAIGLELPWREDRATSSGGTC